MAGRNQKSNEASGLIGSVYYRKRLIIASFVTRIVCITTALICATILDRIIMVEVPGAVFVVLLSWLGISFVYLRVLSWKKVFSDRLISNIHFSYYVPGVFFSTLLVHHLGGAEWVAFSIYLFDIIYSNMLMKRKRGILVTAWVLLCYFSLIFLEYQGNLPHFRLIPMYQASYDNIRYVLSTNVLIVGMIFVLVTYVTGVFARIKDIRERELIVAKTRVELKTRQLEELSDQLRSRVKENEFLRSRAAEYIKEKEDQLNTVRTDLEHQIQTLRKTQRAMQFMIEDLNEMSREIRKVKDSLEEKVKQRTGELLNISSKLHRSERLAFMGKLAGSVTHELRNPMAVIKNAAYFLESKSGKMEEKKIKEYLTIIKKEIGIIDSIIEDIMGFARTKPTEQEKRDLRDIVEDSLSSMDIPDLVKIKKDFCEIPEIMVNSKQLGHAIVNIANNAIMAMKGNGVLTFKISKEKESVCLEIADTGGGIPEEYRELIFEPLYSTRPKGTGLGLPIAKMMVESQNGKIDFTSSSEAGTIFTIRLPIINR